MEKLVLQCNLAPGDLLMLSAAVRDLHRAYPGVFLTDVRTRFAELWENNPYITPIDPRESSVEFIDCLYPLIQSSNHIPCHFLEGMVDFLNQQLHLRVQLTEFRGDIHLSEEELTARSPVGELFGHEGPYWIIAAGGKQDYTIKWWDHKRYQRVVDHFRGRIQFVQVGAVGHYHPELEGVLDMRARTTLRQLVRLMLHAEGVLCPVTLFMHLAAAVPARRPHRLRPCVVIAGGREPPHWEAYPGHQFIHTVGLLPCCRIGGCWRARARPLRDKSHLNQPEHLCVDVVGGLPRCMDLIRAEDVIRRIEMCVEAEAQFTRLIQEEKRKLGDWREASLAGMICIDSTPRRSASNPNGSIDERDLILNHYRQQAPSNKRPLTADLSGHAMTNTPRGLGDTLLLTPLPAVAASQGTVRYIASESGFFEPLMRFNPDYRPAGDRPRVAANVL